MEYIGLFIFVIFCGMTIGILKIYLYLKWTIEDWKKRCTKKCPVCKRKLPYSYFLTNDGCGWCDASYAHKINGLNP